MTTNRIAVAVMLLASQHLRAAEPCISPGELCRLKGSGIKLAKSEWTPSAANVAAYNELKRTLQANDIDAIKELVLAGKVFLTESGDEVRILDTSIWNAYVEVLLTSGKYKGAKVITARGWVVP